MVDCEMVDEMVVNQFLPSHHLFIFLIVKRSIKEMKKFYNLFNHLSCLLYKISGKMKYQIVMRWFLSYLLVICFQFYHFISIHLIKNLILNYLIRFLINFHHNLPSHYLPSHLFYISLIFKKQKNKKKPKTNKENKNQLTN